MASTKLASEAAHLYPKLLGEEWVLLPERIRRAHYHGSPVRLTGLLDLEVGEGPLARVIRRVLGLPSKSEQVLSTLEIVPCPEGEMWSRCIGAWHLRTWQTSCEGCLRETVGVVAFDFRLVRDGQSLRYEQSRMHIRLSSLAVPVPKALQLRVEACETAAEHPFLTSITVRVSLPGGGYLLGYRGQLREG